MKALIRNSASLLLVAMGTPVHAQFNYVTNSDGTSITITGYSGPDAVVIPPTINGLAVMDIGEAAFGNADITSAIIPTSVTNIGVAAFGNCEDLTNVFLPDTLISIGDDAFDMAGLTTVTIPASLSNVGNGPFALCRSLTNVTFQLGLSEIQSDMFGGCAFLEHVIIPVSVTNIGDYAFSDCDSLTNIFFSGNAPAVGELTFVESHPPEDGAQFSYIATAYYLPGTTGWDQFELNTLVSSNVWDIPTNIYVPAVLWNPTIQATGTNFGVQNGQYGFDITTTSTNLPIAIEACDNPAQSNWVVLQRLTLTNGLYHFSELFDKNKPARFFRIGFP